MPDAQIGASTCGKLHGAHPPAVHPKSGSLIRTQLPLQSFSVTGLHMRPVEELDMADDETLEDIAVEEMLDETLVAPPAPPIPPAPPTSDDVELTVSSPVEVVSVVVVVVVVDVLVVSAVEPVELLVGSG